ncbi:MAG: ABC transporter substrate-binding protein [Acidimicrobiales bacterium]|nr:ABC transporter substrate-binding protein [Acidimicrobiales bacterium]
MSSPRARRALAALLSLSLLSAACSDDGGTETSLGDGSTTTSTTSSPANDSTAAPTDDVEVDDQVEGHADNFDSARGVTAGTIKIGVTVPDFDALQAAGLSNYQGDNRIAFSAFIDRINADGGIHGRLLEPVYSSFDFLAPETQDVACSQLAEDEDVFIVLYGLLASSNLCLTELNDTMVMTNSYQDTAARERSGETLWLQLESADDEQVRVLGSVLAEAGRLEGATIGILANGRLSDGSAGVALQEALADLGYDASLDITTEISGDEIASDNELGRIAEKLRSDGVDFLFNLLGGGDATQVMADAGYRPENIAYSTLNIDTEAIDKQLIDGAISVDAISDDAVWNDPDFRATCINPVAESYPELAEELAAPLPDDSQQASGVASWLVPIRSACNQTMLLKQLGEIAGADLNNASFRTALDELGPVELHGLGSASFTSAGKWDGLDEFYLLEYDAGTESLLTIGDPIVVTR